MSNHLMPVDEHLVNYAKKIEAEKLNKISFKEKILKFIKR